MPPRFAYGAEAASWSGGELGDAVADGDEGAVQLSVNTDFELSIDGDVVRGAIHLREDESAFCAIDWDPELGGPAQRPGGAGAAGVDPRVLARAGCATATSPTTPGASTCSARRWCSRGSPTRRPGRSSPPRRPRCPETPGGERNWDYRYSWIRDSTFSLWALHTLGFDEEARDFMQFIVERAAARTPNLQIMYGIGGEQGPDREHPRPPLRLRRRAAGADRQRRLRPAPERRLGGAAGLDLPARKGAAGTVPRPTLEADRATRSRRRSRPGPIPTRGSGRRAGSPSTTSPRS